MLKTLLAYSVIFSLFLTIASASIHITYPKDVTYSEVVKISKQSGEPNYLKNEKLGNIAPGQSFRITIDRASGTIFFWDNLDLTVPEGWKKVGSKSASEFVYEVTVPKETAIGTYKIILSASGDIKVMTQNMLNLTIDVRNDVYSFKIMPQYDVFMDTSNSLPFSIKSDSLATDTVYLSLVGIASDWVASKSVVMAPNEERKSFFLVDPKNEGTYDITFNAVSSLEGAAGSADSKLVVQPTSLKSKLKVLNEGFSIVTVILQPFYSLLSLLGSAL
jgi:uncharacterized membrane protein